MKCSVCFAALGVMLLTALASAAPLKEGEKAPAFAVQTVAGKTLTLARLRGKVVVLDFWGVICPPCKIQMPVLQGWYRQYGRRGLAVVGIEAMGSTPKSIRTALKERGITYPVAADSNNKIAALYGIEAHPTTILIDRHGTVVKVEVGYVRGDEREMEKLFLPLLRKAKGEKR
jgi:peroxiredoxin